MFHLMSINICNTSNCQHISLRTNHMRVKHSASLSTNYNSNNIKQCINSHMSHEDNDPWSFTSTIRNYPNADAKYVLEKNGLRRIAERLCEQFNLRKVMDLCELTDDVIDRITWLETVPRQKLKRYCAICRQRQIETNKPRTSHTTTWTSHTSTVTGQNGDLQPLLESLKGLSNPLPAAPLCRSTRSISATRTREAI